MTDEFADRAAHARRLGDRADECTSKGAIEDAIRFGQEATAVWRSLADEVPEQFSIDLARSLTGLAYRFGQRRQFGEAFKAAKESVALWRQLSATAPEQYEYYLASALWAYCTFQLSVSEKPAEVYPVSSDVVRMWRQLYERNPKTARLPLADSLLFHYQIGNAIGRSETKLLEEAVGLWRQLASEDFSQHGFRLISSLDLLALEFAAAVPGTARWKASIAARKEANRAKRRFYASMLRGVLLGPFRSARTQAAPPTA